MSSVRAFLWVSAVVLSLAIPSRVDAQFEAGAVLGTIRDPSGAVVPNCKVTLENVKPEFRSIATTDANGNFEFVNQHPGRYRVRAEAAGFQTAVAEPFQLAVNARQRVDSRLRSARQPNGHRKRSRDAARNGNQLPRPGDQSAAIAQLPLNGRAYADLTLLSPGVAKSALENQTDAAATRRSTSMAAQRAE